MFDFDRLLLDPFNFAFDSLFGLDCFRLDFQAWILFVHPAQNTEIVLYLFLPDFVYFLGFDLCNDPFSWYFSLEFMQLFDNQIVQVKYLRPQLLIFFLNLWVIKFFVFPIDQNPRELLYEGRVLIIPSLISADNINGFVNLSDIKYRIRWEVIRFYDQIETAFAFLCQMSCCTCSGAFLSSRCFKIIDLNKNCLLFMLKGLLLNLYAILS